MNAEKAVETLKRGCIDFVGAEELEKKLVSGKTLRVKLGADPTRPDLHLGHGVALSKMREFQDMGHTGILLIGDFTACVGDPSGRDCTRPVLSMQTVRENAETYKAQAFKILDPARTEIRCNSEWLGEFTGSGLCGGAAPELLNALKRITLSRLTERDDFKQRIAKGCPITMLELLYSVFQGYDSVALKADVELGGSDQIFNLLVGRDMQKDYGQEPQAVMTMPLLPGTDGMRKMSKSYGNYIGLTEAPSEIFGKVMSIPDQTMWQYYELLTREDIAAVKAMHPMAAKKKLAGILTARLHSAEAAAEALSGFEKQFSRRELPQDMPQLAVNDGTRLSRILVDGGMAPSMNQARQLISQGAVRLDGEKLGKDQYIVFHSLPYSPDVRVGGEAALLVSPGAVLQAGSRRFCRLVRG
ncbi:MAG: tyrosine--tRNA ligase [Elusimicrobiales bacterium]